MNLAVLTYVLCVALSLTFLVSLLTFLDARDRHENQLLDDIKTCLRDAGEPLVEHHEVRCTQRVAAQ